MNKRQRKIKKKQRKVEKRLLDSILEATDTSEAHHAAVAYKEFVEACVIRETI